MGADSFPSVVSFSETSNHSILSLEDVPNLSTIVGAPDLVITSEEECDKLNQIQHLIGSITVEKDLCDDVKKDMLISNYPFLRSISLMEISLERVETFRLAGMNLSCL